MDPYSAYCRYYKAQSGGELPVFRGGLQSGEGIGDFFRGLLRFVAPIAMRGISTFAGHVMDARNKGQTLKEAATGALKPTLGAVASSIGDQLQAQKQEGSGAFSMLRFKHRKRKSDSQHGGTSKRRKVYKKHALTRSPNGQFTPLEHKQLNF
jgi:hypothetical protein